MRGGNGVKNRACEWKPLLGLLQLSALQLQNEIRSNAINETNKFIGGDIVGQWRMSVRRKIGSVNSVLVGEANGIDESSRHKAPLPNRDKRQIGASSRLRRGFRFQNVSARRADAAELAAPTNKGQWQQVALIAGNHRPGGNGAANGRPVSVFFVDLRPIIPRPNFLPYNVTG